MELHVLFERPYKPLTLLDTCSPVFEMVSGTLAIHSIVRFRFSWVSINVN